MDRERRRLEGLGDVMLAHYHYEGAEHWSEVIHPIDLKKMRGSPWLPAGIDIEAYLDGEWAASLEIYRRVGREMGFKEINGRFVLPSEGDDIDGEH